jgi:hypothetical protein
MTSAAAHAHSPRSARAREYKDSFGRKGPTDVGGAGLVRGRQFATAAQIPALPVRRKKRLRLLPL